jgi:hypothetical protein
VFSLWSVHGLYSSELRGQLVKELVMTSDGKGCHKSWLQQWLQSWIRSLPRKRIDSIVVSYKVYTLCLCVIQ